jgi:hypothetical protein
VFERFAERARQVVVMLEGAQPEPGEWAQRAVAFEHARPEPITIVAPSRFPVVAGLVLAAVFPLGLLAGWLIWG